jgi:hypothetical protein
MPQQLRTTIEREIETIIKIIRAIQCPPMSC